jgi:hypothetical protein
MSTMKSRGRTDALLLKVSIAIEDKIIRKQEVNFNPMRLLKSK